MWHSDPLRNPRRHEDFILLVTHMSLKLVRIGEIVDALNPYDPEKLRPREGLQPLSVEESYIKKKAAKVFLVAFIAFVFWAAFFPIDSGVSVQGNVVVMGNRKAVQHPSGGVVQDILVREGSLVKQGDILLRINPLNMQSQLSAADLDYVSALAAESRLVSERLDKSSIDWLPELEQMHNTRVNEAKQLQMHLFNSRRAEFHQQQRILQEQISSLKEQTREMNSILTTRKDQLKSVSEDARNSAELAKEGYVPRSQYNQAERSRGDMQATITGLLSDMAKNASSEAAARIQIIQQAAAYHKDIDTQLADVQKNRKALRSKVESMRFDLGLTEIKAPVSGTVVGLKVNTVGGVIQPGTVLMEIAPNAGELIVLADIPTNLIDKVRLGLEADMRFSAFNADTTPVIPGRVSLVGADRLLAAAPEHPADYYAAQIQTTKEGLIKLADKKIRPGMPVDVVIKTGERSFLSYLIKPITDKFALSFKGD